MRFGVDVIMGGDVFGAIPPIMLFHTMPEKPMKAMAKRPAVIRAMGVPFIPAGMDVRASCSRIPAKIVRASPYPIAVEAAKTMDSSRL